jgi:hypothetical protein
VASATAATSAYAQATAISYGGNGGDTGFYNGAPAGNGGVASNTTAKATTAGSGYAQATVDQYGGNGGQANDDGAGGAGAASTLTNAVSGSTKGGTLTLTQAAVGGQGGVSDYSSTNPPSVAFGGAGGAATSSLTFNDTTNTNQSASVGAEVTANGGNGGFGTYAADGAGGAATATGSITAANALSLTVIASGGSSGIGNGGAAGGVATATGTGTGSATSATSVDVSAYGGAGVSSTGLATATGTGETGSVGAESQASLDGNNELVTQVSSTTQTTLAGNGTVADSATDVADSQFGATTTGTNVTAQGVAEIDGTPGANAIAAVLNANTKIAAAYAVNPSYFALAELGGRNSSTGTGSETVTSTVNLSVNLAQLATKQDLLLGFYGGTSVGSGVTGVTLSISANGSTLLSQTFATATAAVAYFTNDAVDLGSLGAAVYGNTIADFTVSLSVTTDSVGSGFYGNVLIGDPAPTGVRTVTGAAGETLIGSAGADIFAFHAGFGKEVVDSFTASGTSHDVLQFDKGVFADWAHLLGATKQQGSDLLITLDAKDSLLLKNVSLASFTQADAHFV